MAARIEAPAVTVAAGVAVASAVTTALSWAPGEVLRIEARVPPGPSGLMGFRILHSGQQVIPFQGTDWIITDDESLAWDLEDFPIGNKWAVQMYNTDIYPHTVYFRFLIKEIGPRRPSTVELIPVVPTLEQVVTE